jgi:glycosyltransferase involved in cell wall biosynthesis
MLGIKCIGPIFDVSGYAEWCRSYVLALIEAGIPVTIGTDLVRGTGRPITFETNKPALGSVEQTLQPYVGKNIPYDTVIAWLTPEMALEQLSVEPPTVKKINFTLWETDTIHPYWVECLSKSCDELWVPGDFNLQVFRSSLAKTELGLQTLDKIKIRKILTPFQASSYKDIDFSFKIIDGPSGLDISPDTFSFYFISQWSERKNFTDLMEAYWSEFSSKDNVRLILKTYINNHSIEEKQQLGTFFNNTLKSLNSTDVAPISIVHRVLSKAELNALHVKCSCYVNPARGEGLGLGALEATYFNKPVITNLFGEQSSYFEESNSFVYNHTMRPVKNMGSPWYTIKQNWAQPDIQDLKSKMRFVYENRSSDLVLNKVKAAKDTLTELGNPSNVVKEILKALNG